MNLVHLSLTLSILSSILSAVLLFLVFKTISHYNNLTQGTHTTNLITSLNQFIKSVRQNQQEVGRVDKKLTEFIEKSRLNFQKIGFMRFNPFSHTGGDQSFVLCILDENHDGIVISSLHSRENTRVYAKSLTNGESPDQVLSKEEKEVITQAKKANQRKS